MKKLFWLLVLMYLFSNNSNSSVSNKNLLNETTVKVEDYVNSMKDASYKIMDNLGDIIYNKYNINSLENKILNK